MELEAGKVNTNELQFDFKRGSFPCLSASVVQVLSPTLFIGEAMCIHALLLDGREAFNRVNYCKFCNKRCKAGGCHIHVKS